MRSAADYVPQSGLHANPLRQVILVWLIVSGLSGLVLAMVSAAPVLRSAGLTTLSFFIYKAFSYACHQVPERSFYLGAYPLAICARCAGLYAGFAVGTVLFPVLRVLIGDGTPDRKWLIVAALPTSIDFLLGFLGIWPNTHFSRFVTGTVLGTVAAFFVMPGAVELSRYGVRSFFRQDVKDEFASIGCQDDAGSRTVEARQ